MQYNIYFRKDNWDLFKEEEKKSDLINNLLSNHYGLDPGSAVGREYPKVQTKIEASDIPETHKPRFCKNGHPIPYPKDKCLGKGCKYS